MSNPAILILLFLAVAAAFFLLGVSWGQQRRVKPLPAAMLPDFAASVSPEVAEGIDEALERRHKIEAIRVFRRATGVGLVDSKRVIEHWEASREAHRAPGEPVGYRLDA